MHITAREMHQVLLKLPDPYTHPYDIVNVAVPELSTQPLKTAAKQARLVTFVKHFRNKTGRRIHREWALRVL